MAGCCQKIRLPLPPSSFYSGGRGVAGKNYAEHIRKYYPDADVVARIRLLLRLGDQRLAQGVPMKKGALELLVYLRARNIPCVVDSLSSQSMIENNLRYAGIIGYFCALVSEQDVSRSKPDPETFRLAASKLRAEISRCVVLEDSPNGVRRLCSWRHNHYGTGFDFAGPIYLKAIHILLPGFAGGENSARTDGAVRDFLRYLIPNYILAWTIVL